MITLRHTEQVMKTAKNRKENGTRKIHRCVRAQQRNRQMCIMLRIEPRALYFRYVFSSKVAS